MKKINAEQISSVQTLTSDFSLLSYRASETKMETGTIDIALLKPERGWLWRINKFLWPFGIGGALAGLVVLAGDGYWYEASMQGVVVFLMCTVWRKFW